MSSDKEEQKMKAAKPTKAAGPEKAAPEVAKPAETKPVPAPKPAAPPATAAPPAKQEPEPPAFEKGLAQELVAKFGDAVKILYIRPIRIKVETGPSSIVEVATYLRDSMGFDHAESASGTDYPKENQIEVNYHLGSYTRNDLLANIIVLTTKANRDDPRVPSLIRVYPSVEYHERETYEMLGVYFEGHPRMERFLLPEDWADIPPLRKDFRIKGR
ncbi:NADH-quinone oxidoreductase subunit C [Nitrososphaera sp.]|uniref:NADH-quinone oxidoreductase subunit C n=1 Tax=Nitrososphaera sp. TaxID=1971748 RepID=UPI002EDA5E43